MNKVFSCVRHTDIDQFGYNADMELMKPTEIRMIMFD